MGRTRIAALVLTYGVVSAGAASCLSLGDSSSSQKNDAGSKAGTSGIDGAAGWPGNADSGSDAAACTPCAPGTCVDLTSDPANCGACGNACTAPTATCLDGACVCNLDAVCNDVCVSLTSNKNNCGACDNKCPQGYGCHGGQCCAGC